AAESALRKALSLEPQSSRVHLAWGIYYSIQKDLKSAGLSYQKAAELAPQNAQVWLRWADFNLSIGSAKEARDIIEQLPQRIPDCVQAWTYLARLNFESQNFRECSNLVQRILVQDRGNYEARLLHARLKRVHGHAVDAIKELEECKRDYNGSPEIEFELAL